jgi:hypothetical protein
MVMVTGAFAAALLSGSCALAQSPAAGPIGTFEPHFRDVLERHGVVGGGFAFVY